MMDKPSFNEAMELLHSQPSGEKRKLNKLLREHFKNKIGVSLSVKEADYYVQGFADIRRQCNELAAKNVHSNDKSHFQALVFDRYPTINSELKEQWIQAAYFATFR